MTLQDVSRISLLHLRPEVAFAIIQTKIWSYKNTVQNKTYRMENTLNVKISHGLYMFY